MKKLLIFSVILMIIMSITVYAAQQNQNITIGANEVKNEIVFAAGQSVVNNGTINNDMFAVGQLVTNTGRVNGDILAAGQTLSIGGNVNGNIRLAGSDITIKNLTERNVSVVGNNITVDKEAVVNGTMMAAGSLLNINGNIKKGLYAAGANVIIDGTVTGDTVIDAANITISPNAKINGNLTYTSQADAVIAPGAVTGTVNKILPVPGQRHEKKPKTFASEVFSKLGWVVGSFILGALLIRLFKDYFTRTSSTIKSDWGKYLGIGALAVLATPIAAIILLITVIGIPVSLTAILIYFVLLYLAKIPVSMFIGEMILKDKSNMYIKLLLGLAVLAVIFLIPYLGGLSHFVVVLVGAGTLLYNLLFGRKESASI